MNLSDQNQLFILTGAPGVGKTSLLAELAKFAFQTVPEPARIILARQRAINGPALPEKNPMLFCEAMLTGSIEDYNRNQNSQQPVIFDRGIPDNIAYAGCFDLDTTHFIQESKKYYFNKTVFLLTPWKEIYATDDERKMNFDQVCEFHKLFCKAYLDLKYNLVEVPRASTVERAIFVRKIVDSHKISKL